RKCPRSVRLSTAGSPEGDLGNQPLRRTEASEQAALEEAFFLGLRLTEGLNLREVNMEFGQESLLELQETIKELVQAGMILREKEEVRLTPRGRLLSNEAFERFIHVGHDAI